MELLSNLPRYRVMALSNAFRELKSFGLPLSQEQEDVYIMVEEAIKAENIIEPRIKIGTLIERFTRITHTDLLQRTWRYCTARELYPILAELKEMGLIEEINEGRKKFYVWKGGETQNELKPGFVEKLNNTGTEAVGEPKP